ncbi:RNA polymerase sigma factor [Mucilaginibacter sp. UYCu711]|uniref:RNA polymerase sigma factor n=1 Tax=Mucilaginibacter sp. UYCu711 TaxID=3156339 RepID=UPI003D196678
MELYTDTELLELIVNDNYKAFTFLYDRYFSDIKRFVLRILKSPQLTEDVIQEVFIQVWLNRSKLSQVNSFKAYLFITARNRALDSLKAALRSEVAMGEIIHSFVAQRNGTDEEVLDKEYSLFLNRILASLPERTRQIFTLCREQGKSYKEVAGVLGISRNAVKNHMVLSMKILGSSVKKELGVSLTLLLACVFKG